MKQTPLADKSQALSNNVFELSKTSIFLSKSSSNIVKGVAPDMPDSVRETSRKLAWDEKILH